MDVLRRARCAALLVVAGVLGGCGSPEPAAPTSTDDGPNAEQAAAPAPVAPVAAPPPPPKRSTHDVFFEQLSALCGKAFAGYLTVGTEPGDREFGEADMTMHVRDCSDEEIRIPFNVGENRSRTWVVRRFDGGLALHHRHLDEAGEIDEPNGYGGHTRSEGSVKRQVFVVDEETKAKLPETKFNVWAMEVHPGKTFAYELQRPEEERFFRVEFELDQPAELPPPSWGEPGAD